MSTTLGPAAKTFEFPGAYDDVDALYQERGWTDGLPIVPPTEARVKAFLNWTDREPHEIVGVLPPRQGEATVERGLARLVGPGRSAAPPPIDYEPNVFVYDGYPGGIGLSEPLYRLHDRLIAEGQALIASCRCRDGCPSCVGPVGEVGSRGKEVALAILDAITGPAARTA